MERPSAIERIEAKLAPPNEQGCRLWTGAKTTGPIPSGIVSYKGKRAQVRRVIYELLRGPVPSKMFVRMTCGNVLCGNADHMELSTAPHDLAVTGNYRDPNSKFRFKVAGKSPELTAWGETKTLVEWMDDPRCKVPLSVLRMRLHDNARREAHNEAFKDWAGGKFAYTKDNPAGHKEILWPAERAVSEPPHKHRSKYDV